MNGYLIRTAWAIARQEIASQTGSLRFVAISILVVVLAPVSIYVGVQDYRERQDEYRRLVQARDVLAQGNSGQAVLGVDSNVTSFNELEVFRVVRPPQPLSVLVRGLDGALSKYWDFSALGIEAGPPASSGSRLADTFQHLDFGFLAVAVLGLLAVLLGYDAVVGEKEAGTLRAVLSQPVPRPLFLAGKFVGGSLTLLGALALACLSAIVSLAFFDLDFFVADSLLKFALIAAASGAYLVCIYALGLMISSLTSTLKTSLLVALVSWFLLVLAIAPLATLLARTMVPIPSSQSLMAQKSDLDGVLRNKYESQMGHIYRDITGDKEAMMSIYREHRSELFPRIRPVISDYIQDRRRTVGRLGDEYDRDRSRQQRIARSIMLLSPAAALASISSDLAGTGDVHFSTWKDSVQDYQRRLDEELFEDPPMVWIRQGGASFGAIVRDLPSLEELPRFEPPQGDAVAAILRASPVAALLILYGGLFVLGAFLAFSRYDVR